MEKSKCGHCGNEVYMQRVIYYDRIKSVEMPDGQFEWDEGPVYTLFECPICSGITLYYYYFHEYRDPEEWKGETLYPLEKEIKGLPTEINKQYQIAQKVRNIDGNLFAVSIGRLIEQVCLDQGASGKYLPELITSLGDMKIIPERLAKMAYQIGSLRNIGAHANKVDIAPDDIPILDALCRAILEYVYTAPMLIEQVAARIKELNEKRSLGKHEE